MIESDKRGHYRLVRERLANTLDGFVQKVCPVSRPLNRESAALRRARSEGDT